MLLFLAVQMAGVFLYTFSHLVQRCLQLFGLFTYHIVWVWAWLLEHGSTGSLNANFLQWFAHSLPSAEQFTLNSVFRYLLPSFNLFASSVTLLLSAPAWFSSSRILNSGSKDATLRCNVVQTTERLLWWGFSQFKNARQGWLASWFKWFFFAMLKVLHSHGRSSHGPDYVWRCYFASPI